MSSPEERSRSADPASTARTPSSAVSLAFFDPEHGLYGTARAGATLLFDGDGPTVLPSGPDVGRDGDAWQATLDGSFELTLKPVAEPARLGAVDAHLCEVTGKIGSATVSCLGTVGETHKAPEWDELDALRSISAAFDRRNAVFALARRPRGVAGHGLEGVSAWMLREGEPYDVEDARISTVYDGEGRQRGAGLELWMPGEEFPRRTNGTVVAGSSLQLEGLSVHVAFFRWRMEDREGAGAYELWVRPEPPDGGMKAIISDFGGVLTTPLGNSFAAWSRESGVPLEDLGRAMATAAERHGEHPLFVLEKGQITQAEFLERLDAELPADHSMDGMLDTYFGHLERNPEMIEYVRELRDRGLRAALLTNNVREWEPRWRPMLPEIDEIFEVVVDSAFVGMRKPEPEIYLLTLERLGGGIEPADCVFVDDIEINCDAARELGMSPVVFETTEQARREIEKLLDEDLPE